MQPITKAKWKTFTGKMKWDCIVALRGPDCHNPNVVKWYTTAVIRWLLSRAMRVGGTINDQLGCVILPVGAPNPHNPQEFYLNHFTQHTWEAAEILDIPTLWIPNYTWTEYMMDDQLSPGTAGVRLYNYLVKSPGAQPSSPASLELRRYLIHDLGVNLEEKNA